MNRRILSAGFAFLVLAVAAAGFVPWRVTGWVQRWLEAHPRPLLLSVDQARWIPWKHLELDHIRIRTPGGGKLHLVRAEVSLRLKALAQGKVSTEWNFGEIRMDPGSWKIRQALATEMLSAMPVTTQGSARLNWPPREVELERLWLTGPVLHLQGAASFPSREEIHLQMQGSLSRSILVAMQLLSPSDGGEPWQPFHLELNGLVRAPSIRFESNFRSFIFDHPVERKP